MQPAETSATKGLAHLMHNLVSSNLWAHQSYVDWLKAKPAGLMDKPVPSSFPSIRNTLVHIWSTERFWLSVLREEPPPPWMNNYDGPVEDVFTGIVQQSAAFKQYVHSLNDAALQEDCTLDTPWAKGIRPRYDFITHCMSHSAYHRGQIVTIGRNIGIEDPPMTDYNAYLMMRK